MNASSENSGSSGSRRCERCSPELRDRPTPALFVGSRVRDPYALCKGRPAGRHRQPAERPLIDETQLGTAVGESEADPQVRLVRAHRLHDQQLSAHPEMGDQRIT